MNLPLLGRREEPGKAFVLTALCADGVAEARLNCHFMRPTLRGLFDADTSKMSDEELRTYLATLKRWKKKDLRQLIVDEAHGRPEHEGFTYVLSNPAMPGILKVGCTTGTAEKRAAELSSASGVPQRYRIERTFPVYLNPGTVEKKIHSALDTCRLNDNREFFRISVEDAVLRIQAVLDGKFDFL